MIRTLYRQWRHCIVRFMVWLDPDNIVLVWYWACKGQPK